MGFLIKVFVIGALTSVCWPRSASAQIVRGQVVDSITSASVRDVSIVLLDATGGTVDSAVTDISGYFLLYGVHAGGYQLRATAQGYRSSTFPIFQLAIDDVKGFRLLLANLSSLSSPTGTDLIDRVCAGGSVREGQGVILGRVRDANGNPAVGVDVIVSWPAVSGALADLMQGDALGEEVAVITTDSDGFYAACGVPAGLIVRFNASRRGLQSVLGAVEFTAEGVVHEGRLHPSDGRLWLQDLVLQPASSRTATLHGSVIDADGDPVAGATVEIAFTGFRTETDVGGLFALDDLPNGYAKLNVRAVGYREASTEIELREGERVAVGQLVLDDTPTVLAPIRVEADAPETRRPLEAFNERRKSSTGSFITRAEFLKQGNPQIATDVLRRMGGMKIVPNPDYAGVSDTPRYLIVMTRAASRASFGNNRGGPTCAPIAFLDGHYLGVTTTVDVDGLINLNHIEAVEAYASTAGMPLEFNRPGATCGVVAFWSR